MRLPVVTYKGKEWFLDERLKEIRNITNPHEWIDFSALTEKDVLTFKKLASSKERRYPNG